MPSVRLRAALCLLLALAAICSLVPCAFAEGQFSAAFPAPALYESAADTSTTSSADSAVIPENSSESVTSDAETFSPSDCDDAATGFSAALPWPSAEAAILDLLNEFSLDDSGVALAYYNTVTGEEYLLNADRYMVAASLYKVPLNMVFAERVANGELDPDSEIAGYPYRTLRDETLINSDNDLAAVLRYQLGDYYSYRRAIAPYMGVDPDYVDAKYYENNLFTTRQMLTCLQLLYNEPERFPSIIETMQQAQPNEYFCQNEHRYNIAHKYGYVEESGILRVNDCGIIPTQDPVILVCFTAGIGNPEDFLTAFCSRCIDYTEAVTAAREAAEQAEREAREATALKEAEAKAAEEQAAREAEEARTQAEAAAEQQAAEAKATHIHNSTVGLIVVVLFSLGFVCIVSFILFILRLRGRHYGLMFLYLTLCLISLAFLAFACRMLFS